MRRPFLVLSLLLPLLACQAGGRDEEPDPVANPVLIGTVTTTPLDAPPPILPQGGTANTDAAAAGAPATDIATDTTADPTADPARANAATIAPDPAAPAPAAALPAAEGAPAPASDAPQQTAPPIEPELASPDQSEDQSGSQPAPTGPMSEAEAACRADGGLWSRTGNGRAKACIFQTPDGGKECDSKDDCVNECLARSRTCSPIEPLFGCHKVLMEDGAAVTLCLE